MNVSRFKRYTGEDAVKLVLILCSLFAFLVFLAGPLFILFVKKSYLNRNNLSKRTVYMRIFRKFRQKT